MNMVILCEGSSDAAFIGQYMKQAEHYFERDMKAYHVAGWFDISNYDAGRISMYDNPNGMHLAIWAVNGSTKMASSLHKILTNNQNGDMLTRADAIAMIIDYDSDAEVDAQLQQCLQDQQAFMDMAVDICARWCEGNYDDGFGEKFPVWLTAIKIPLARPGAMETFLMDTLSQHNGQCRYLVGEAEGFIGSLVKNRSHLPNEYLKSRRDKVKAPLATYLAVAAPNRIMDKISDVIASVDWSQYQMVQTAFKRLSCQEIQKLAH